MSALQRSATTLFQTMLAPAVSGLTVWNLSIANDSSILDLTFYLQSAAIAPSENPLGVLPSNGIAGRIGN